MCFNYFVSRPAYQLVVPAAISPASSVLAGLKLESDVMVVVPAVASSGRTLTLEARHQMELAQIHGEDDILTRLGIESGQVEAPGVARVVQTTRGCGSCVDSGTD